MILVQKAQVAPKAWYDKGYRDTLEGKIDWDLRFENKDYRNGCAAAEQECPQPWQIDQYDFHYHSEGGSSDEI